jgi:hypothetical protein
MTMKKGILTSVLALGFAFCFAQGKMEFDGTSHEFGDVKETGGPIMHDFKFKNTGDQPIIISNVQASCGCTTPDWSKAPVGPGETGFIKAQYNPLGRPGQFNKSLTITSNSIEPSSVLFIKGNVVPDAAPATEAAPAIPTPAPEVAKPVAPAVKKAATPAKKSSSAKKPVGKPAAKKPAAKKATEKK